MVFPVVCWLALVSLSESARAETEQAEPDTRPRVVVLLEVGAQNLATRIQSELATMGFDASVEAEDTERAELSAVAHRAQAVVAARVQVQVDAVRLWLFDRTTEKTLMREIVPESPEGAGLSLHIVELLRASLLELSLPEAPRGDVEASPSLLEAARVPPSPAPVPAPAPAPSNPFLTLEFGPAVVAAAGGLRPFAGLELGAGTYLSRRLRIGAFGIVPLGSMHHEADEGSSETQVALFGLEACFVSLPAALRPFACVGPVLALLQTRGDTQASDFDASSDTARGFGGVGSVGAGVALGYGLRLSPELDVGVLQRYFAVDYASREVARWGPWFGALMLTLQGEFE